MKKFTFLFALLIAATTIFAQAPQAFNYQAVVRDAAGNLLQNQAVGIKISLLQGSATGTEVYAETHATTTNQFGQVDLKIGTGAVLTGQFDTISWNTANYHLQLSVDLSGGANYQIMGTTQMLSVPYALYAEEGSGWEKTENGIGYFTGNVGIGASTIDSNDRFHIKMANGKGSFRFIDGKLSGGYTTRFKMDDTCLIIGHNSSSKSFSLTTNDTKRLTILGNGNMGIGTTLPTNNLDVNGIIGLSGMQSFNTHTGDNYMTVHGTTSTNQWLRFRLGGNTPVGFAGITFSNYNQKHTFLYAHGDGLRISTSDEVSEIPNFENSVTRMLIGNNGFIGIGTLAPSASLHIGNGSLIISGVGGNGTTSRLVIDTEASYGHDPISCRNNLYGEIFRVNGLGQVFARKVIVQNSWSDFVFDDDYSLMPLHQLDKFIEENKHLPEIPSAKEVEANGISLGDMDAKLLQKIEELTLYTIEQQKVIEELVRQNEEMQKQMKKLKRR